jgi:hypothetical protein
MDREDGTAVIVRTLKHGPELEGFDGCIEPVDLGGQLGFEVLVFLSLEKLSELRQFGGLVIELVPRPDPALQPVGLRDYLAGLLLVIPKAGSNHLLVEFCNPNVLGGDVKDTPEAQKSEYGIPPNAAVLPCS